MFQFLRTTPARVTTLLLLLLMTAYYAYPKNEKVPLARPLKEVPLQIADWHMMQESQLETEVLELLRADDTLNRIYSKSNRETAALYVAFFKTQTTGVAPHSPKVCLPGSGWVATESGTVAVPVPGRDPIHVNRYVVSKGEVKSVVLYWYQSPWRVIASEYSAKIYTVIDSFLHHRSDTSLVRVVVPVTSSMADADMLAKQFVGASYNVLRDYLPK